MFTLIQLYGTVLVGCWTLVCGLTNAAPETLRLVNLVYRHGDRSAFASYPNNPNRLEDVWPDGLGWLTPEGMRMQFSLGSFLRRRYHGFLKEQYDHTEIRVESSDVERCLMSAYSNLAGLYPPRGGQVWDPSVNWQPIPVHTRPREEDRWLAMGAACPRYEELLEEDRQSDSIRQEEATNKEFYEYISRLTGNPHEDIESIWKVADNFYCEEQHNITWAGWMNRTVFNRLRQLEAQGYTLQFGGEKSRFKGGPLVKEWVERTQDRISDPTNPIKMNMFSAHDSTVVAVLSALHLHNNLNPPYTAVVLMEVHEQEDGRYHVQLYYRNHSSTDPLDDTPPHPLTLPGCELQCPFEDFVSLTKNAYPDDWQAECLNPTTTHEPTPTPTPSTPAHWKSSTTSPPQAEQMATEASHYKTAFIITISVYSAILLLLLVVVMVTCCKYRRGSSEDISCKA